MNDRARSDSDPRPAPALPEVGEPWSSRILSLVDRDDRGTARARYSLTTRIFLLIIAADQLHGLHYWTNGELFGLHVAMALAVSACAALAFAPGSTRYALWIAAGLLAADLLWAFPDHANHQYLSVVVSIVLGLFDGADDDEARSALAGLRWVVIIGLAWAGLQKILWGYYFDGTFLSFAIAERETFQAAFGWILPGDEIERLANIVPGEGAGPFRIEAIQLVALSNLTWITEIGLALGMLGRRTGALSALGMIALLVAIELAAREVFFGLLMTNLLCLWLPLTVHRRAWPGFAAAVAVLMLTSAGWLPYWWFS